MAQTARSFDQPRPLSRLGRAGPRWACRACLRPLATSGLFVTQVRPNPNPNQVRRDFRRKGIAKRLCRSMAKAPSLGRHSHSPALWRSGRAAQRPV